MEQGANNYFPESRAGSPQRNPVPLYNDMQHESRQKDRSETNQQRVEYIFIIIIRKTNDFSRRNFFHRLDVAKKLMLSDICDVEESNTSYHEQHDLIDWDTMLQFMINVRSMVD